MTCPSCEYNKQRAAIWRAEAYKQAGHDVIQRPWIPLTAEEREQVQTESYGKVPHHIALIAAVEKLLKEKNCAD
jgi:2-methylisocitrate lyase-like PEP mutase family enzyme